MNSRSCRRSRRLLDRLSSPFRPVLRLAIRFRRFLGRHRQEPEPGVESGTPWAEELAREIALVLAPDMAAAPAADFIALAAESPHRAQSTSPIPSIPKRRAVQSIREQCCSGSWSELMASHAISTCNGRWD